VYEIAQKLIKKSYSYLEVAFIYRSCILSIALYGFQLWFYNKALLAYPLKKLRKMRIATIWILGAFHTSSTTSIKAVVGLIPIHLHLQKLSSRFQLRIHSLLMNHISKQWLNVKGSIIDANNRLNRVFPSFIPFSSEFLPGNRLIDIHSTCFSFYSINKSKNGRKEHIWKLNNLTLQVSDASKIVIVISDTSIKNQVATLIAHIHIYNNPVIKTFHHAVNIMSTKAELFAIRYDINQATQLSNINCIVIIMDLLHAAKQIFDWFIHIKFIQI